MLFYCGAEGDGRAENHQPGNELQVSLLGRQLRPGREPFPDLMTSPSKALMVPAWPGWQRISRQQRNELAR